MGDALAVQNDFWFFQLEVIQIKFRPFHPNVESFDSGKLIPSGNLIGACSATKLEFCSSTVRHWWKHFFFKKRGGGLIVNQLIWKDGLHAPDGRISETFITHRSTQIWSSAQGLSQFLDEVSLGTFDHVSVLLFAEINVTTQPKAVLINSTFFTGTDRQVHLHIQQTLIDQFL